MFDSVRWNGQQRRQRQPEGHLPRVAGLISDRLASPPYAPLCADTLATDAYAIFRSELPHLWASGIGWRFLAHRDRPRFEGAASASLAGYYHVGWNLAVSFTLVIQPADPGVRLVRLVLDEDWMAEDRMTTEVPLHRAREAVLAMAGDLVMLMWDQLRSQREWESLPR